MNHLVSCARRFVQLPGNQRFFSSTIRPSFFVKSLQDHGIKFWTGVPDSLLNDVCSYISDVNHSSPEKNHILASNEGNAVGLALGHYLATKSPAVVYMQNSGIGNAVNPLLSLADKAIYRIPMLMLIGWRGEPGIKDEPQHVTQGLLTEDFFKTMRIPYEILPEKEDEVEAALERAVAYMNKEEQPYALLVRKGTFEKYKIQHKEKLDKAYPLREEYLRALLQSIDSKDLIVSTTGKSSREIYELRDGRHENHSADFLTVGGMGHCSSIALSTALEAPERQVLCVDGDGAVLMHMGSMPQMAVHGPANLTHVVINNGAHESVGGLPTVGMKVDLPAIAEACGYKNVFSVSNEKELAESLEKARMSGPSFIHALSQTGSRDDLGRPKTTPLENRTAFMQAISELKTQ
eukprot:GCRY01001981.1.p1 GENE.GCRY01001981.1~~GCRY01001981.1.p1  ORF type:complete len:446 (+),score=110.44 GCRY01001981.1:122-1339(+)